MTTTRGRGRDRTVARPTRGEQAELARAEDGALLEQQVALARRPRRARRTCWPRPGAWVIRTWATPRSVHS